MSSPPTTAQQRPKASKANCESSQGDDQGDDQADPFRPWHHANKPGLKRASRRQNGSWPAHVRKIPVTKSGLSASVPGDLNTTPRSRLSTWTRPDGLLAGDDGAICGWRVSRPIELVVLNCWVAETNDTLCVSKVSLFGQRIANYNPLNKNRRECLEELRTGDGRSVPARLMAEILREIDRLELVLLQISERS
jgi:hypothetical protein